MRAGSGLARIVNADDFERHARRRLPRMVYDTLAGGAGDEVSLRQNRAAFERIHFRPRVFSGVARPDTTTAVFGGDVSLPLYFSPTGAGRLARPGAELLVARAAREQRLLYAHSSVASFTPREVFAAGAAPMWFQLYLPPDPDRAEQLLADAHDAGYSALVLTVDSPVRGNRERDRRNRFFIPYRPSPHLLVQGLSRPVWSAQFVAANLRGSTRGRGRPASLRAVEQSILQATYPVTLEDLRFVRERWSGPLLVKGLMRADECRRLIDSGVNGVIVSNHGGRQLDGLPAPIDVLPSVVRAAGGELAIYLDGGIRRGADVVKALALGATACGVGRPYLWALAAAGYPGLLRLVEILREEVENTLALLGASSPAELDPAMVARSTECK